MDSITQIVLGAACGEAVLGKKIGNKALLFGAIGGTIPDLDVFIGEWLYSNEIDAMMFHRGFMHAMLFAVFGAFLFGTITYKLYNTKNRVGSTTQKNWIGLYFLSIFTHPILDSFTPYGTQLFAPFSNYRVAFNNISVADPFYTVPFLLCIIILLFFNRKNTKRAWWLKLGIYISSLYMLFTIVNKLYIDSVLEKSFKRNNISYHRFSSQPTILNNFLWYGIAESKHNYHVAFYSLFDKSNLANTILTIPKNHHLIDINHPDLQKLRWFSNEYYNLEKNDDGTYNYIDLRYPILNANDKNSSVFKFTLVQKKNRWDILPFRGNPPNKKEFNQFIERIKGI